MAASLVDTETFTAVVQGFAIFGSVTASFATAFACYVWASTPAWVDRDELVRRVNAALTLGVVYGFPCGIVGAVLVFFSARTDLPGA